MKKLISLAVMILVFSLFSTFAFADTYTGVANGRNGEVEVNVTVEDGVIKAVEVGSNSETPAI